MQRKAAASEADDRAPCRLSVTVRGVAWTISWPRRKSSKKLPALVLVMPCSLRTFIGRQRSGVRLPGLDRLGQRHQPAGILAHAGSRPACRRPPPRPCQPPGVRMGASMMRRESATSSAAGRRYALAVATSSGWIRVLPSKPSSSALPAGRREAFIVVEVEMTPSRMARPIGACRQQAEPQAGDHRQPVARVARHGGPWRGRRCP